MKNYWILFSVFVLVFTASCSKDDDGTNAAKGKVASFGYKANELFTYLDYDGNGDLCNIRHTVSSSNASWGESGKGKITFKRSPLEISYEEKTNYPATGKISIYTYKYYDIVKDAAGNIISMKYHSEENNAQIAYTYSIDKDYTMTYSGNKISEIRYDYYSESSSDLSVSSSYVIKYMWDANNNVTEFQIYRDGELITTEKFLYEKSYPNTSNLFVSDMMQEGQDYLWLAGLMGQAPSSLPSSDLITYSSGSNYKHEYSYVYSGNNITSYSFDLYNLDDDYHVGKYNRFFEYY